MDLIPASAQQQCLRWRHSPQWLDAPVVREIHARLLERLADIKLPANAAVLHLEPAPEAHAEAAWGHVVRIPAVVPESQDAVVISLLPSAVADVPRLLHNAVGLLKPDGVLLASLLGRDSFPEWQQAWAAAGSAAAHVGPFPTLQTAAGLLQKLQLALPVADRDVMELTCPSMERIVAQLRAHGVANSHPARNQGLITPRQWAQMEMAYRAQFGRPDGRLPVTLEILYLHAFKPGPGQPVSARRGSGTVSLVRILGDSTKGC